MKAMRVISAVLIFLLLTPTMALAADTVRTLPQESNPEAEAQINSTEAGPYQVILPIISKGGVTLSGGRVYDFQTIKSDLNVYEKFEAEFNIETKATDFSLPYDPNRPSGLGSVNGVSVDVSFTPDNWKTVAVQPAFYYQPYKHSIISGKDHFVPDGGPRWMVRFTPQVQGAWQYRITIRDAEGTSYFPGEDKALSFNVGETAANPYLRRGFLRVSKTDPRYFEFQNSSPFIGMGFNDSFSDSSDVEEKFANYENNKMDFMRVWMSGHGINGSQWSSWASHHLSSDGYIPGVSLDINNTYNGGDVSFRLDGENPCLYGDFWQGGIPAVPNTTYQVWARVKVSNVNGPAESGDYGFVIKRGGWLDKDCSKPGTGTVITEPLNGSSDWVEVNGTFTTGSDTNWLDNFYLVRQNATGGEVYIDEVRVWRADDPNKVNILREPEANSHMSFDPMSSAMWDLFIEAAEEHGVYLKLVIDEKNEWIRNRIRADGTMSDEFDNNNFYAKAGTKVRWLQEAWWRYIIARWGYSPAIHSFEYINEGDPYNGNLHDIANAMARYFDTYDPSRHMVTTSFWSSFPNKEFWSNPAFTAIDYADLHAYINTGWGQTATLLDDDHIETDSSKIFSGNASARVSATNSNEQSVTPRGIVLQGEGEWIIRYYMKADGFTANCPSGSSGGMQRLHWRLDGGDYWGGAEGIVPGNSSDDFYICSSPGGTFDWKELRSDKDRDGNKLPEEHRLIIHDNKPHELSIKIENSNGSSGTAWFDQIQVISPSGEVADVLGDFDITPMDDDTAWYNHAYGDVFGGGSPVGAGMPLVRGETGIDFEEYQDWNRDLPLDIDGVWLHNNVWGQVNHGGMYELFWWVDETIPESIFYHFLTFANFMQGIPLDNGQYQDAKVETSHGDLRAWGQRDDQNGRMHLWIQNEKHTWKRVVYGDSIPEVSGTVTLRNVADGTYTVEWWDPYAVSNPIIRTDTTTVSGGTLTLNLPYALDTDIAVKIMRK